jgi:hypothetical protein
VVLRSGLLFSGVDKRGHRVTLEAKWFYDHIHNSPRHTGEFRHCWPFPKDRSQACLLTCDDFFFCLDEALRDPATIIRRDKDFDDRDNYYGPPTINLANLGLRYAYLKVCVAFRGGRGRVITAFHVDEISAADRPLVKR